MNKLILSLTISLLATQAFALTQEGTFKIDEVGHAEITIKQTLNAQQWQQWMGVYGSSQHVLKRDLKNEFSIYHMADFNMSRRDSDREFEVSFTAHGAAVYRGNDRWEVEIEEGVRARKLGESQWLIQMTQTDGGEILEQDFTFELPAGVTSSEKAVGEFGDEVIRYVLPTERAAAGLSLYGGGATLVGGILLLILGFTRKDPQLVTIKPEPVREIAKEAPEAAVPASEIEVIEHDHK